MFSPPPPQSPPPQMAHATNVQAPRLNAGAPGMLLTLKGKDQASFIPWTGQASADEAILEMQIAGGGQLVWLPGSYEIEHPFEIWNGTNLRFLGYPGATLTFPSKLRPTAHLAQQLTEGQTQIKISGAQHLELGAQYQVFPLEDGADRLLELRVTKIDGDVATIHPPVAFMKHVSEIPSGLPLVTRRNFFEFNRCQNIRIDSLVLDGRSLGTVSGHTTYCGIIIAGLPAKDLRPISSGFEISNCTFRGLQGRGIAAYKTKSLTVRNSTFSDIFAQAIEIDHFSTGLISGNSIQRASVGVALNDAFNCTVQYNNISNCGVPISFVRHFQPTWANTGHTIRWNDLRSQPGKPVISFKHEMEGNIISQNFFRGCTLDNAVVGGGGNHIQHNIVLPVN